MRVKNIFLIKDGFTESNSNSGIENIYYDEYLRESVDNDMISAAEEGFMLGYVGA
jgi:hypothetical protein